MGTMDGEHRHSAGRVGFEVPFVGGRPEVYNKLIQIPWQQNMSHTGHVGLHVTSGAVEFVAAYVAPLVLAEQWDEALMYRVCNRRSIKPTPGRHAEPDVDGAKR